MLDKLKEIVDAWYVSYKPTEQQKELALERYKICLSCEFYGEKREITGDEYCKDCLCPLNKKIYSLKDDACPQHKWIEVEKRLMQPKNKKTLI